MLKGVLSKDVVKGGMRRVVSAYHQRVLLRGVVQGCCSRVLLRVLFKGCC